MVELSSNVFHSPTSQPNGRAVIAHVRFFSRGTVEWQEWKMKKKMKKETEKKLHMSRDSRKSMETDGMCNNKTFSAFI